MAVNDWAIGAKCKGLDPVMFEYTEVNTPNANGLRAEALYDMNKVNFELAAEVCIECPVFFECIDHASKEDKMWTVRGGEPPKRFDTERDKYEAGRTPVVKKDAALRTAGGTFAKTERLPNGDRFCHVGHLVPGGGRCRACIKIARTRIRKENKV